MGCSHWNEHCPRKYTFDLSLLFHTVWRLHRATQYAYLHLSIFYWVSRDAFHRLQDCLQLTIHLDTLDVQIVKLGWDIEKFHDYVKLQLRGLTSRGATMDEGNVITNLQLAYLTVEDQTFKGYMIQLPDNYNNSRCDFDVDGLMDLALNRYKTLREAGLWKAKSPDQEKIIALSAQVAQWEKRPQRRRETSQRRREMQRSRKESRKVETTSSGLPPVAPLRLNNLRRRLTIGTQNTSPGRSTSRRIVEGWNPGCSHGRVGDIEKGFRLQQYAEADLVSNLEDRAESK